MIFGAFQQERYYRGRRGALDRAGPGLPLDDGVRGVPRGARPGRADRPSWTCPTTRRCAASGRWSATPRTTRRCSPPGSCPGQSTVPDGERLFEADLDRRAGRRTRRRPGLRPGGPAARPPRGRAAALRARREPAAAAGGAAAGRPRCSTGSWRTSTGPPWRLSAPTAVSVTICWARYCGSPTRSIASSWLSNQSACFSSSRTISSKTAAVPWSPRSWHSWARGVELRDRGLLAVEREAQHLLGGLADGDRAEPLHVGVPVEHQDPVDERVGVLHLVDRQVVEDLAEPAETPVVEHAGVQEVGVGDGQLERERLVEQLDDTGANWLQRRPPGRVRGLGLASCSHTSRLREKTQEPQSWPAPVARHTAASERAPVVDRLGDRPVGDDAAVAHDHGGLLGGLEVRRA